MSITINISQLTVHQATAANDPAPRAIFEPGAVLQSAAASAAIDVRDPPRMIKLDAQGALLPPDAANHAMVLLPDFGLIFDARAPAMADNWADAKRRAEACDLPGNGWRLPEREELQLLIDPRRHNPAINAEFFPHTPTNDWYWSATALASSPADCAWFVAFDRGYVLYGPQSCSGFVRACRRVPPGQ